MLHGTQDMTCPQPYERSIHPHTPLSLIIHFNIHSHLCLDLPSGLLPSEFPSNNVYVFFVFSMPHIILLDLINLIMFCLEFKL